MRKIVSLLTLFVLVFSYIGFSAEKTAKQIIEESGKKSVERAKQSVEQVIQKAVEVVAKTQQVIFMLAHGKEKEALKLLEEVKKEMAELDKQYKGKLTRLPVNVAIMDVEGVNDIQTAEKLSKQVKESVKKNDYVTARFLLDALKNEIDIQTAYLPIALYKQATDLAYNLLKKGQKEQAIQALQVALSTIEVETTIIPKPLAEAQILIEEAKKIYKTDKNKALALLEQAKYDVKLAKVLGYIPEGANIKPLIDEIEKLEKAIKEESSSAGKKFEHLFKSIEKAKQQATQTK